MTQSSGSLVPVLRHGSLAIFGMVLLLLGLQGCMLFTEPSTPASVAIVVEYGTLQASIKNLDAEFIRETLDSDGYIVSMIEEPSGGVTFSDLAHYSVIVYSGGTWSHLIGPQTPQALAEARSAGIGVVVVGDDAGTSQLTEVTGLGWGSNYGETNPTIHLIDFEHPILAGLEGSSFGFEGAHGDVDEAIIRWSDVQVLAHTALRRLPVLVCHDDGVSREVTIIWEVARTANPQAMKTLMHNVVEWVSGNGPSPQYLIEATVTGNPDGDDATLDREIQGKTWVRYTGIDTPELTPSIECFAVAATDHNRQLTEGKTVWLELDERTVGGQDRLLAYVRTAPDLSLDSMVNYQLLLDGYAKIYKVEENWRYIDDFRNAQIEAVAHRRGMWAECGDYADADIVIAAIQYWGRDESGEFVVILNRGAQAVNLDGWTLSDRDGNTYEFPGTYDIQRWSPIVGSALSTRTVHSGPGANQAIGNDLQWTIRLIWDDEGDTAYLRNPAGEIVSTYEHKGFLDLET